MIWKSLNFLALLYFVHAPPKLRRHIEANAYKYTIVVPYQEQFRSQASLLCPFFPFSDLTLPLLHIWSLSRHQQANDETEQAQDRAEDLNDKNLDEPAKSLMGVPFFNGFATYSAGSAASANAALLPFIPTDTPQIRLHIPTVIPPQNSAKPV
jgi:hypothetical protein